MTMNLCLEITDGSCDQEWHMFGRGKPGVKRQTNKVSISSLEKLRLMSWDLFIYWYLVLNSANNEQPRINININVITVIIIIIIIIIITLNMK